MISPLHRAMVLALAQCTFLPGSPHKRFARDLPYATDLTEAQVRHLVRLCWRYRRQMPAHLVPSKDAVDALDADWNARQAERAAEKARAKREKARAKREKAIARAGGVQEELLLGSISASVRGF